MAFNMPDMGKADDGRAMLVNRRVALRYPVQTSEGYAAALSHLWKMPKDAEMIAWYACKQWANPRYEWDRIETQIANWMKL
jgi:hypothetical protein